MVERRRKPLVLSSTKTLINSLLNSSNPEAQSQSISGDKSSPAVQLQAGILRLTNAKTVISDPKLASFDDSALVGLSTSLLKKLSITSGSLVHKTI